MFEGSIGYKLIFHFRNMEMEEFGFLIHSFSALRPLSWFGSYLWSCPQLQRVVWLGLCLLAQPGWILHVTPFVRQSSLVTAGLPVVAGSWVGGHGLSVLGVRADTAQNRLCFCDIAWITSCGSCECLAVLFLGELVLWLSVLISSSPFPALFCCWDELLLLCLCVSLHWCLECPFPESKSCFRLAGFSFSDI